MVRPNRKDIVDPFEIGIYHCYSRCVQGAFLCGYDSETGANYEHRKEWVEARQELLAGIYAMELLGYAVLDNHMHHVIRTRPDLAEAWSDEEVVRRWFRLHPQKNERGEVIELTEEQVRTLTNDTVKVSEWRRRLASLSWYMKDLKEDIAKRANRESGTRGHFFESRFNSPRLADTLTLLLCLLYVDLNGVRAGMTDRPEAYQHSSFSRRVRAEQRREQRGHSDADVTDPDPDAALQPLSEEGDLGNHSAPVYRPSDKGILPMTSHQYFEVTDWVGRQQRKDKRGAIPRKLDPILERIGGDVDLLADASGQYEHAFRRSGRSVEIPGASSTDTADLS